MRTNHFNFDLQAKKKLKYVEVLDISDTESQLKPLDEENIISTFGLAGVDKIGPELL